MAMSRRAPAPGASVVLLSVRERRGRERVLRSNSPAAASTRRWLGAASITRLQYASGDSHNQNAWTEVEAMNRYAHVPASH